MTRIAHAMTHHSDGFQEGDATMRTCRDADRLDLPRVGIHPDPARLCTEPARRSEVIEWARKQAQSRQGWAEIVANGTGKSGPGVLASRHSKPTRVKTCPPKMTAYTLSYAPWQPWFWIPTFWLPRCCAAVVAREPYCAAV